MSLREDLNQWTPRMRRYARALCGGATAQAETADDLVHAALLRVLRDESAAQGGDIGSRLYAGVTDLHRQHVRRQEIEAGRQNASGHGGSGGRVASEPWMRASAAPEGIVAGLSSMKLGDREAILLVVLEQCGYAQASRILKISRAELIMRLARARLVLGKALGLASADTRHAARAHLRVVK